MKYFASTVQKTRLGAGLCCLLALGGCVSSPYYSPTQNRYETPAAASLRFEEVTFASADGTRLTGWFLPASGQADPRNAKATVVHFHGNAQNMTTHWRYVSWLPPRGFNVFVFDYRGYGASDGKPEPKGVFEDSNAALSYVRARRDVDPERLVILGQSLGGTNAIATVGAGNRAGVKAMVIESTFYSYANVANGIFPGLGLITDNRYSATRFIEQLAPIPLLLIHGTADTVIPYENTVKLFAQAGEPKSMITVEGGKHIDALSSRFGTKYQDAVATFFEGALSNPPAGQAMASPAAANP